MSSEIRISSSENQWQLDKPFYSLGRSRTADLKINRSEASRIHIFFFHDADQGFLVSDAGSRNGAYLNGQLIQHPTALGDADVIDVASEPLHVNMAESVRDDPILRRGMESVILMGLMFNDDDTDWGSSSKKQSRAKGEWFYRSSKLIMSHGGQPFRMTEDTITGIWDQVDQNDKERIQSVVECSRQINQFAVTLDEGLREEWGIQASSPLFRSFCALHYTPVKLTLSHSGIYKIQGDECQLLQDLVQKASDLNFPILSTERFPSRQEDRSTSNPMCMAEVGARKQAMVLFPLRED
jgi:hypothetical protein